MAHGEIYARDFGWDTSFEALVARIVAGYAADHDPSREAAWIAEADGKRAGCIFCVTEDDDTARLRILLVDPSARGSGLGQPSGGSLHRLRPASRLSTADAMDQRSR